MQRGQWRGRERIHLPRRGRRPWLQPHRAQRAPLASPGSVTNHVNQYELIAYLIMCDTQPQRLPPEERRANAAKTAENLCGHVCDNRFILCG